VRQDLSTKQQVTNLVDVVQHAQHCCDLRLVAAQLLTGSANGSVSCSRDCSHEHPHACMQPTTQLQRPGTTCWCTLLQGRIPDAFTGLRYQC
jgi:hypothetical protein